MLWICVFGWSAFVGLALWWLCRDGGFSVWVSQEGDLNHAGIGEKVQGIFRGELGLQRIFLWSLFGPFVALMGWYFPLEREHLRRNLPLSAVTCLVFVCACQVINLRTSGTHARFWMVNPDYAPGREAAPGSDGPIQLIAPPRELKRPLRAPRSPKVSLRSAILDLLVYGAITGLVHSVNFYGRLRERERRALFLESNLAKARLNTLKAQLRPHFLFNSLNAITALLRRDPRLAETTLVSLSELLRMALSQSERQELALREELEFVQRYLEIQQTRFGDKLRVEQEIEPAALDCLVPTLVLQPLVENAIRHGIEPSEKAGVVRVSASRKGEKLVLVVEDSGVGLANDAGGSGEAAAEPSVPISASEKQLGRSLIPPGHSLASAGTGIGLANLRQRLEALYGGRQKLELMPRETAGVIVRVEIPWRSVASSE